MNKLRSEAYKYAMDKFYSYENNLGVTGGATGVIGGAISGGALYNKFNKSREKFKKYDSELNKVLSPKEKALAKKLKDIDEEYGSADTPTEAKLIYAKFKSLRREFELNLTPIALKKYAAKLDHMDRAIKGLLRSVVAGGAIGGILGAAGGSYLGKKLDKK